MDLTKAIFEASYGLQEQLPDSKNKEIVMMGRSNVGKSTLINALINRKSLARVSSTPGKTATINFYNANQTDIIDLPGYGYAKKSKSEILRYKNLISYFFDMDRKIALIILLIDIRHKPSEMDINTVNFLIDGEYPFIIALTKADKLKNSQINKSISEIKKEIPCSDQIVFIKTSAKEKKGVNELLKTMEEGLNDCNIDT